jgi:type I restriction enzyme S subunit
MSRSELGPKLSAVALVNPRSDPALADDTTVSFLTMSAVDADKIDAINTETRLARDVKKGYTPFAKGDVLVAKITPCFENGKIAQANISHPHGFGSTEFHVLRPRPDVLDARYLAHFLRIERIRLEGEQRMTGSGGQRRVPEQFFAELRIPLPPLPEQRRIAEILDRVDALRSKRRAAVEKLDALTQAIFFDMFGDVNPERRKWPTARVTELSEVITKGTTPSSIGLSLSETGIPFLRVQNVRNGEVDISVDPLFISMSTHRKLSRSVIFPGDVLISIAGTIGRVAIASSAHDEMNCNQAVALIRPKRLSSLFLASWLGTDDAQRQIRGMKVTGTISNLSLSQLGNLRLSVPPDDLQRRFAQTARAIKAERSLMLKALALCDELGDSIKHRVFGGGTTVGSAK